MNDRGFSLYEMVLACAITGLLVIAGSLGHRISARESKDSFSRRMLEHEILSALQIIRRVGRVARACRKVDTALECDVDFTDPVSKVPTPIRFEFDPGKNSLHYQRRDSSGTWATTSTYKNVQDFRLCDDTEMNGGACTLLPAKMSEQNAQVPPRLPPEAPRANRFFRYQIIGMGSSSYQGAFYVRNPTSLGPNIFYQYGGPQCSGCF